MHFSQSKSTICEIFAWNFDFSETAYCRDLRQVPLDLAHLKSEIHATQAILMHFSQSKSTKWEILGCFLNYPNNKWKKMSICAGKGVWKDLKICTYRFLEMPITMHYVRTLCDKYFLRYYGFPWYLIGRFRHRVLKHGVRVEWDPRRTTAQVLFHFDGL